MQMHRPPSLPTLLCSLRLLSSFSLSPFLFQSLPPGFIIRQVWYETQTYSVLEIATLEDNRKTLSGIRPAYDKAWLLVLMPRQLPLPALWVPRSLVARLHHKACLKLKDRFYNVFGITINDFAFLVLKLLSRTRPAYNEASSCCC